MKLKHKIFTLLILSNVLMGTTIKSNMKTTTENIFCKLQKGVKICIKVKGFYPVVTSDDNKTVEKSINDVISKLVKRKLNTNSKFIKIIEEDNKEKIKNINKQSFAIHLLSITPKSFSLKVRNFYSEDNTTKSYTELLNYDILTEKTIGIDSLFVEGYRKKLKAYAESIYRIQNRLSPKENTELIGFKNNKFFLPKNIGIGRSGLYFEYDCKEKKKSNYGSCSFLVDYRFLKEIINPKSYLSVFLKEKEFRLKVPKYYKFIDRFGIIELAVIKLSETRIEVTAYLQNKQVLKGGGLLSLSFSNFLIDRSNISSIFGDFSPSDRHLYSIHNFEKEKKMIKNYSLLEAHIKQWKSYNEAKKIGFDFDIPENMETLELDIYANFVLPKTNKVVRMPFSSDERKLKSHKIIIDLQ